MTPKQKQTIARDIADAIAKPNREAFEKWAPGIGLPVNRWHIPNTRQGEYVSQTAQDCWLAWQEATRQANERGEPCPPASA